MIHKNSRISSFDHKRVQFSHINQVLKFKHLIMIRCEIILSRVHFKDIFILLQSLFMNDLIKIHECDNTLSIEGVIEVIIDRITEKIEIEVCDIEIPALNVVKNWVYALDIILFQTLS